MKVWMIEYVNASRAVCIDDQGYIDVAEFTDEKALKFYSKELADDILEVFNKHTHDGISLTVEEHLFYE